MLSKSFKLLVKFLNTDVKSVTYKLCVCIMVVISLPLLPGWRLISPPLFRFLNMSWLGLEYWQYRQEVGWAKLLFPWPSLSCCSKGSLLRNALITTFILDAPHPQHTHNWVPSAPPSSCSFLKHLSGKGFYLEQWLFAKILRAVLHVYRFF